MPGFERAFVVDVAPQLGIRQTRLLEGQYVMTKEDVAQRRHFPDSVARGRDYYYSYRSLLPNGVGGLLVAGRHYSATPSAQKSLARNPALHGDGRSGGNRGGAGARKLGRRRRHRRAGSCSGGCGRAAPIPAMRPPPTPMSRVAAE